MRDPPRFRHLVATVAAAVATLAIGPTRGRADVVEVVGLRRRA